MATVLCFKASIDFEPHEHKQRKRTLCCICATQSQSQSVASAPGMAIHREACPNWGLSSHKSGGNKWNFAYYASYLKATKLNYLWGTRTRTLRRYLINSSLHAEASQIPVSAHSHTLSPPLREALPHAPTTTACLDYLHSLSYTKCSPVYCAHVNTKTGTHT